MIVKKIKVIVTRSDVPAGESGALPKGLPGKGVHTEISPLRYPGFPLEVGGVGELHAAFFRGKPHTWMLVRAV
jgi:hypothetical protein